MYRRLYYLFPTQFHTRQVVDELEQFGIEESDIHTFSNDVDAESLPGFTPRDKKSFNAIVEKVFWNIDLVLFFFALVGLLVALYFFAWGWVVTASMAMVMTYLGGKYLAEKDSRVQLDEFDYALQRHEILLSVDVPKDRVQEVDKLLHKHPEATAGGASWTLHHFGI